MFSLSNNMRWAYVPCELLPVLGSSLDYLPASLADIAFPPVLRTCFSNRIIKVATSQRDKK